MIDFIRPLKDIKVTELPTSVTFECELNKAASVQWYKKDEPIRGRHKYDIVDEGRIHRLTIKDVDGKDEADYTIIAKNNKSKANLSIQGKYIDSSVYVFPWERKNPLPPQAGCGCSEINELCWSSCGYTG